MHPVVQTLHRLKGHLLTYLDYGIFLDINATITDTSVYAESRLDHVVVTNPDVRVCNEIRRLCTSRPIVHVLNIDVTKVEGMIQLQSFLSGKKLQMIFWRYYADVDDMSRLLTILNGILDEQRTIHVVLADKEICAQYRTTNQIGYFASNVVFSDKGYECSTVVPSITITDMIQALSTHFRYMHVERLSSTALTHHVNLTPYDRDLADVHSIICMVSKLAV